MNQPAENMNQPIRIMLVDDEKPARNRLRDLLADCESRQPTEVVAEAGNGRAALDLIGTTKVDLVLLDIRMPEIDGIEVAQHLQKLPEAPAVIFTTAYDDFAVRAFELHAVDYLLKPIRASRLLDALTRAKSIRPLAPEVLRELGPEPRSHLSVHERGRIHLIPIGDVVYLKAELKYVTIKTLAREYLLEESLTRLETEYAARFVRIHRSCLVAKDAVAGFEKATDEGGEPRWVAIVKGLEEKLPISRRQQHIVKEFGR